MRVLYFHQYFSTMQGSTGTRSYQFAQKLVELGHYVTIVTGRHAGSGVNADPNFGKGFQTVYVDGIRVLILNLSYSNYDSIRHRSRTFVRFALEGLTLVLREEFDVLFATSTPLTVAVPGILAKWIRGKPFVFEVRDLWPELPQAMGVIRNPVALGMLKVLEKAAYASADGIVALSPGIQNTIQSETCHRKPVVLIPNCSDTKTFQTSGRSRKQGLLATFTGAHGQANGLHAILDAAKILKSERRFDIRIRFIGDGKLKPDLIERAKCDKLDNCEFLDPVSKQALGVLLLDTDVGLMVLENVPAFSNGTSPNKFFDYLAAGLPVLTNYPGWVANLIESFGCGIAVPPANPSAFAAALCSLADNPQMRREMGRRSRHLAEDRFSVYKLSSQFARFLEDIHNEQ